MNNPTQYYGYDLETFPNFFFFAGMFEDDNRAFTFEISTRKNQRTELVQHLNYLRDIHAEMFGFNNLFFDHPIIHELLVNPYSFTFTTAYNLAQALINSGRYGKAGGNLNFIRHQDRIVPQIDLFKINHFDNAAKSTSLKALQFAMRSESVEDLPIPPGTVLTFEQMDKLSYYGVHDLTETVKFFKKCKHLIEQRRELRDTGVLTGDVLNFSDVKIGTEYLIKKIGRNICFSSGSTPRKTFRTEIVYKDIILPKIYFRTEPYQAVLDWFKEQIIYVGSDKPNPSLEVKLAGLDFKYGVGGIHASVENKVFESNDTMVVMDIDITGAYVAAAIVNGFAPEHLGDGFKVAYKQLQSDRAKYKKGTTMNGTLKLAGNGVFGNSDNQYSCFYDPKYPKQVTVNVQLQLTQLVELLSMIPQLQIIQANTDGITAFLPRSMLPLFELWKAEWESMTGLQLEQVEYKKMWIRDVNNYLVVTKEGKIKRKGAYWYPEELKDYDGVWNKDFSMMVVQKAIGEVLINDWNPEALVRLYTDPFDFMIRYKTPAGAKVYIGDREMSKTVRYYVSTKGEPMKKVSVPKGEIGAFKRKNSLEDSYFNKIMAEIPPGSWDERIHTKNKTVYEMVTTSIESEWLVKECNDAKKFDRSDINYDYYIKEIKKLMIGEIVE